MRGFAWLFALLSVAACHRKAPRPTPARQSVARAPASPAVAPAPAPAVAPAPPVSFVGAARCAKCHSKNFAAWQKSWHARALAPADRRHVEANFDGAHFAGSSSEAWTKRHAGQYVMRTHGPDGELADFKVDWVIGGKRMQDSVTLFPDGRWQVLPVYWQVRQHAWVDYTESKQGPLAPDNPFYWTNFRRMANRECLDCHTAGLTVKWQRDQARWSTHFVDAGVACEDCHGPGARHSDSTDGADIFSPKKATPELALSVCAQCHGPRNPLFPLFDTEHRFHAGQRYDDFYDPIVVLIAGRQSDDFFADGRPKSSSFEYQALLQSACYRRGGATCLSCHGAPHDTHVADELRTQPDETCRGCHASVFAAGVTHTHHRQKAAQSCRACHMPKVVSGVLDKFADHSLDVPVPENSARHGVPNACGTCHADWTAAQDQKALLSLWPQAAKRQERRLRLADAFDANTAAQSLPALRAVIADEAEAPTLRGAAAVLLAERFPAQVAAALPLLSAHDITLRQKGCEALAVGQARFAVDDLAAKLDDPALRVRQAATLALAALGDARAEPALVRLTRDPATNHLMDPHWVLGRLLAQRGDLAGARRELSTVVQLTPYFAEAMVRLAEVEAAQGDVQGARSWVADALRLDPRHPQALQLQARLGH